MVDPVILLVDELEGGMDSFQQRETLAAKLEEDADG